MPCDTSLDTRHVTRAGHKASHGRPLFSGQPKHDESGAVLILALFFSVVVSVVVLALATSTTNGLLNVPHFKSARSLSYAAGGGINVAIATVRYTNTPATTHAGGPTPCMGTSQNPTFTLNGQSVEVWCGVAQIPPAVNAGIPERVVTFSACGLSANQVAQAQLGHYPAQCNQPFIQATVTFVDGSDENDCAPPSDPSNVASCGYGMSVNSWIVRSSGQVPGLASIDPVEGSGQSAATGSNFANPLVALVADSFGNPLPGANVTFTAPPSGASLTPAVSSVATDPSGLATTSTLTANGIVGGPYRVTATSSQAGTAIFTETNVAVAGIIFEPITTHPAGATQTCSSYWSSTTVTANNNCSASGLGGAGTFSASVALAGTHGALVANTGGQLTVNCAKSGGGPGNSVSPTSSTIAPGASTSADTFTMKGGGGVVMTCTVTIGSTTYQIAVTGH
jgi:hypothetical protein